MRGMGFWSFREAMSLHFCLFALAWANFGVPRVEAAPDLMVRDNPGDTGVQPNPDPGHMYVTQDIWVRNNPDPGWSPEPFANGTPPWTLPSPLHQNPEYRDPRLSVPCFVYVYVTNRGNTVSSGNEYLRLFWAKASTGLSWPSQWSNYVANTCGPSKLYGQEITKPRKNAADATAGEITQFVNAINSVDTAAFSYPGGDHYWDKQTEVHLAAPEHSILSDLPDEASSPWHNPSFLPWHREFINRLEILLQQVEPTATLFYWDWNTDPRATPNAALTPINLFGGSFMGASGGPSLVAVGAPFTITPGPFRRTTAGAPPTLANATVLSRPDYATGTGGGFANTLERNAHNPAHNYFGSGSDMVTFASPQDPFFFLLHAQADRLWAEWQRDPNNLSRLDPDTTYGVDASHCTMISPMRPWKGPTMHCRPFADPLIAPWSVGSEHRLEKLPTHASIVSPPIYDRVPLRIPRLDPGESVILQIPWYPPNRADFACFGDPGHFCLLARIEGDGPTTESANVGTLTRNNNNVAWKNITVVDDFTGQGAAALMAGPAGAPPPPGFYAGTSVLIRNIFSNAATTRLTFSAPGNPQAPSIFDYGRITIDMKGELYRLWQAGGSVGQGIEPIGGAEAIQVFTRDAFIGNIRLGPGQTFFVNTRFELNPNYPSPAGRTFDWDFTQFGTPTNANEEVGGNRFTVDFNRICLIRAGSLWQYWDAGTLPDPNWMSPDYGDANWSTGKAELGYGDPVNFFIQDGVNTAYFRHSFNLGDPSLVRSLALKIKRDDGAIVYLNGKEVYRANLPAGGVIGPDTFATASVEGTAEDAFYRVAIPNPPGELASGRNVVAVEVHQYPETNRTPDLRFDLELCANSTTAQEKPYVGLSALARANLYQRGQPIVLNADAVDVDDNIQAVEFFQNGNSIAFLMAPPFQHIVQSPPVGIHRFSTVAYDTFGGRAEAHVRATVVSNLLPVASMTLPTRNTFPEGLPITFAADATDSGGSVASVEFRRMSRQLVGDPSVSLGIRTAPPYQLTVSNLAAGMHMITAVAKDNLGAFGEAAPLHIHIISLGLRIRRVGDDVLITWTYPEAVLQSATKLTGPWSDVPGAFLSYRTPATEGTRFFRLRLLDHTHVH